MFASKKKAIYASLAIALLLSAYFGPSGYRKTLMDREVDRLCAVDGGAHVFEVVHLPRREFDRWGNVNVPFSKKASGDALPFVAENYSRKVSEENAFYMQTLTLHRFHYKIIRKEDKKVLGEAISYARVGGDPGGPWHPSSYRGTCSSSADSLEKLIFKALN